MDFRVLLGALSEGDVRFVLVGGVAATLQGVTAHTFDVDVVHARDPENARRLAAVLRSLGACYREHLPKRLEPREQDLMLPGHHLLWTRLGPLDLLGRIAGEKGYEDLIDRAPLTDLGLGLRVHVLDLEVIVETKELLGRDKDRAQLHEYRRTLEERRRMKSTNPNQALWEKGDFTRIAATMRESGEELVGELGLTRGMKVLDLGCGDGTSAVPAAKRGADVLGVDIARNLVEAGNRRAKELDLANLRFQQGDASDLKGLEDGSFDLVVTLFGAMFAPKPFEVAREMVRVTRPGGRIVMGNWIPNDPTLVARILTISAAYTPPPPEGFVSPMTWGIEGNVNERFRAAAVSPERISCVRDTWTFRFAGKPSEFVAVFRDFYGPTMNAFEAAGKNGKASDLLRELEDLFRSCNTSGDGRTTTIPATFLRVTVSV